MATSSILSCKPWRGSKRIKLHCLKTSYFHRYKSVKKKQVLRETESSSKYLEVPGNPGALSERAEVANVQPSLHPNTHTHTNYPLITIRSMQICKKKKQAVQWHGTVIYLVVPSKTGGGWEVEPRAGGSVSFAGALRAQAFQSI